MSVGVACVFPVLGAYAQATHTGNITVKVSQLDFSTWSYQYNVSDLSGDPIYAWYVLSEGASPRWVSLPSGPAGGRLQPDQLSLCSEGHGQQGTR